MLIRKTPYIKNQITVSKYGENIYRIVYHSSLREAGWYDERQDHKEDHFQRVRGKCNDGKLSQSISRSRSRIYELSLCNEWDRFITLTLDKEKVNNRYDLNGSYSELSRFFNNFKKYRPDFAYVLIPEKHVDGAWHFHGMIRGLKESDIRINSNGFPEWRQYRDKFGYNSLDGEGIRSPEAVAAYITKYITKDLVKSVNELNAHCYYCSKNLNRREIVYRGSAEFIGKWDYAPHDGYVKVKTVDIRKESLVDYLVLPENESLSDVNACDTFQPDMSIDNKNDIETSVDDDFICVGVDDHGNMTFLNPDTGEVFETRVGFDDDSGG